MLELEEAHVEDIIDLEPLEAAQVGRQPNQCSQNFVRPKVIECKFERDMECDSVYAVRLHFQENINSHIKLDLRAMEIGL